MPTGTTHRAYCAACLVMMAAYLPCDLCRSFAMAADQEREPKRIPPRAIGTTGRTDPKLAPLDELMTSFVAQRNIPGAALAVTRQGRVVYARGFGSADREQETPVEPDSLFRIASLSKPLTAVAILQLVEHGRLNLDGPVFDLLAIKPHPNDRRSPDPRLKKVTARRLLQHSGGWDRQKSFDPMFRPVIIANALGTSPPASPQEIIRYMLPQPLDFEPGERYAYSNFGYCVLGRIIEKVSGQPYEEYVRQHVLLPMGVTRMRVGRTLPEQRAPGEVRYYPQGQLVAPAVMGPDLGKPVPVPYGAWCIESMDAHGGWIASAVDLVKFARAFDDPAQSPLLKPASVQTMFARPAGSPGHEPGGAPKAAYYACGWQVRPVGDRGGFNAWHMGSLDGTATLLVRRHDGFCWAVLFNTRNAAGQPITEAIDPLVHRAVDAVANWPEPIE